MGDSSVSPSLVSVVMAAHNAAHYLEAALVSILEQSHQEFEFIVVDDGSTDDTFTTLNDYAARDSRIRLLKHANAGLTASLRRAIDASTAPFIARMDADDVSLPTRLESQVKFLLTNPSVTAVGSQVLNIDDHGCFIGCWPREREHNDIVAGLMRGNGGAMCHPAIMFRRDAYNQIGGYDNTYRTAQDLDLYLRLAEVGRLANLDAPLLLYRIHPGSTNARKYDLQIRNREQIVRAASGRRGVDFHPTQLLPWPYESRAAQERSLAWKNLTWGNVVSARLHSLKAVAIAPFSSFSWKTLIFSLLWRRRRILKWWQKHKKARATE